MPYARWLVGQQSRSRSRNRNHPGEAGTGAAAVAVPDATFLGGLVSTEPQLVAP